VDSNDSDEFVFSFSMASPACPVEVASVVAGSTTFFPTWSYTAAVSIGRHIQESLECGSDTIFGAVVEGYTTPAVNDIGAATVRLRFVQKQQPGSSTNFDLPLRDGGYLLAIRSCLYGGRFLPAVAGVPGQQGLDRYGKSRIGLAECVVMGRPVSDASATVLPDSILQEWLPAGSDVEVVVLTRLTDFFLGMNAGTWLRVRIDELVHKGEAWVCEHCKSFQRCAEEKEEMSCSQMQDALLEGTGLKHSGHVGVGIEDSSADFQYWGGSGNSGVSGQVIWLAEGTQQLAAQ